MNKIIIVGASSGLGRLMAINFIKAGWLVGAAARNSEKLAGLQKECGENLIWENIDVTSLEAASSLEGLITRLGGMDVYLHVSGICHENPNLNVTEDLATIETNVSGFTRMIDYAYAWFRENKHPGRIAAITSLAGTKGIADLASYSASKRFQWTYLQALEQLSRHQDLQIKFTDIRPGWTHTPLIDENRRYMLAMQADKVADIATRAILSGRRVKYINWIWSLLAHIWRIVPSWLWTRIYVPASKGI